MNQQEKLRTFISVLLFVPIWFFVYAFLHEAGHALVGLANGGTIENFVFWNFNAHVRITGASYSQIGEPLMNVAGLLFPMLIFVIVIGFYNSKIKFAGYHLCYFTAILSLVFGAFAGWVVVPIRSMFTLSLAGEDMVRFSDNAGFHPFLVSLMGLFIIGAFAIFAHKQGVFVGALSAYRSLLGKEAVVKTTKIRWGFVSAGFLFAAIFILAIAIFLPYTHEYIFAASAEISDVRTEGSRSYAFSADGSRQHNFHLDVLGQGIVTGFIVEDSEGNRYFSWAFQETSSVIGLGLSEGVHNVRFIFLTDFETVVDFLKKTGSYEHIGSDVMQNFREVFSDVNDNFSVTYSLRIR